MGADNIVRINIGGQEYSLRTSADKKYIKNVAKYVNDRIKEVENSVAGNQSQLRTVVLSAMNITDDLFAEKKRNEKFVNRFETKLTAIREYISEKINSK
jgi:cell division protein ZapA